MQAEPETTTSATVTAERQGRHHLALALLLFALLPIAGHHAVWSADEGALLYQVDSLADGRGWAFDHPFPAADPDGIYFPIHLSSWAPISAAPDPGPDMADTATAGDSEPTRYIVLAKHTWFLWLATGLYRLGGYGAILAVSVAAALAAAIATSRLAAMIEPAARIPALWIIGLGSPLFVGAYVAWAHTLGAALIGWAAVGLLADRHRTRGRWRAGGLALLTVACLVRTEAPLAGLAIGLGLIVAALVEPVRSPGGRRDRLATGTGAVIAAVVGLALDRATDVRTGGPVERVDFDTAFGFLGGRLQAFTITWLRPAYGSDPRDLLVLLAAALTLTAGILARRGPAGANKATVALTLAFLALLVRFVVTPAALIPGLVVAFPILFAGLGLIDRKMLLDDGLVRLVAPFLLFCGAVLATQYRHGGGGEWGGRYFAVGLPLGAAAASVALVRVGNRFAGPDRRRLGALAAVSMLLLSTMGLAGLRSVRNQTEDLGRDVARAVDHLDRAGGSPVVVTTVAGAGRWLWEDVDRGRWLRIPAQDLELVGGRLHDLGVERLAFVSADPAELSRLEPWYEVDDEAPLSGSENPADVSSSSPVAVINLVARP